MFYLSTLLFNFALEYANRKEARLEMNGTHKLLAQADFNILRENISDIRQNTETV
jgi:hypothetical protein